MVSMCGALDQDIVGLSCFPSAWNRLMLPDHLLSAKKENLFQPPIHLHSAARVVC
jgi:hypothetical protein